MHKWCRRTHPIAVFPELSNLQPYRSPDSDASSMYQLTGIVVHEGGSASSGHFRAYVYEDGTWLSVNGARVAAVTLEEVLNEATNAYLLSHAKSDHVEQQNTSSSITVQVGESSSSVERLFLPECSPESEFKQHDRRFKHSLGSQTKESSTFVEHSSS